MASSPFIDLNDEIALRRYLMDLKSNLAETSYLLQQSGITSGVLSTSTSAAIKAEIQANVKAFDESMWSTINEVSTNLRLLIPSDNDIVQIVTSELGVTSSDLTTAVKDTALVAIAEDGTWATSQSVTELSSNLSTNYATTTVLAATYATQTAVGAIYEVGVEANGHVSGYRSVATGEESVFQIYAEKFAVSSSSTEEGYSPFQIDTVNHKINMTSNVAIDGNLLVSGTVTAAKIAAETITADKIAANAITSDKIAANTITANDIAAGTITATEVNVSNLQSNIVTASYIEALNIKAGSVDAEDITGTTITGKTISGGTITGTTINASTINIRNLNLINDAGYSLLPIFFSTSKYTYATGIGVDTFYLAFDMYTYNSASTSPKRFIGTNGTTISFSKVSDLVLSAPVGYVSLLGSDDSLTALDLYIKVGTTTLASKTTTWTVNTVYSIGGFRFSIVYDTTVAYDYTFCLLETSDEITLSSTSSSPITIEYSCDVTSITFPGSLVVQAAVSNL